MAIAAEAGALLALTGLVMMTSKSARVAYSGLGCIVVGFFVLISCAENLPMA